MVEYDEMYLSLLNQGFLQHTGLLKAHVIGCGLHIEPRSKPVFLKNVNDAKHLRSVTSYMPIK